MISGKASIILLTYNNLHYTQQCLESIYAKTDHPNFEVIVVDNASQDETPQYLQSFSREHPNFSFILNPANEGFPRGNNIGAAAAKGDTLVFLNNDTIVTRGWLEGLLRHLDDPRIGMVSPVTNGSCNETRILHTYEDIDGADEFAESYCNAHRGQFFEIQTLAFMCVALRRQTFDEIGPLDERFGLGMFEDDDYAMRLRQRGYKLLCVEDVYIHHWGGGSFLKMAPLAYWQLFRENRAKFEEKWNTQWRPHLNRPELLPNQVVQLTESGYNLQWNLLYQEQLVERLRLQVDDLAREREHYLAYTTTLTHQITKLNQQITELNQQITERDQQITFLNQQVIARNHDLEEIRYSKAWKVVQWFWHYRIKLLPHNSLGERILLRLIGRGRPPTSSHQQIAPQTPATPVETKAVLVTQADVRPAGTQRQVTLPITPQEPVAKKGWDMSLYLSRAIEILRNEGFGPLMRAFGRKVTAKMCGNTLAKRIALPLTPENSRRPVDLWDTLYAERELHKGRVVYTSSGKKRVAYFTNQLLDWVDQRPRYGGGERYCLNLSSLLRDLGFEVDLYQIAFREFTGEYHGYHVKAIPHGDSFCEFNIGATEKFHKLSLEYDHVIYNLPELSSGKMRPDAIAICHGIWFDHNNYARQFRFRTNKWFCYLYRAFKNPKKIVSVDTNSVNVIRALWPELATKMTVIPNFVDKQLFFPPVSRNNPKPLILFPRRSQINRGSRILADILKNVPRDVDFFWVGEGDDYDTKLILDLCKKDQRLHYANASFEEMPEWYRKADIVVIPTIACEGTSLSCIEALASGCATIATNVGGLTDIIQNEVNGLLVNPTPIEIADAIDELIKDPQKREQYQKQGFASSAIFSIDKWRKKWLEILTQEKWIDSDAPIPIIPIQPNDFQTQHKQICIITRNAIHGGVESLIELESRGLGADVIVAGGLRDPFHSCPFPFTYVETYDELRDRLKKYDVVVYSWPYDWAVQAIRDSGLPSIEVVHRTDTAECDKSVPSLVVTHSQYLIEYLKKTYGIEAGYLPNAIDTQRFFPSNKPKAQFVIGAITSYYDTKGVDLVLRAWALIAHKHPDVILRFYGAGSDLERYKKMAEKFRVNVEFYGPTSNSALTLREYSLFIHASRIEGLPIVVLEALATNLPVIASNIDGHIIINRLAEEKGLGAPLTLFETENFQDLAKKIEQCLAYPIEPNGREVIEAIFSAEIHNAILQQMLYTIAEEHPKTASVHFECIDRSWNNGVARKAGQQEGFHTVTFTDTVQYQLSFTHRSYLIYDYIIPKDAHAISCLIYTANNNIANVFVQFNWCTEQDGIVSDVCGGRLVDEATEKFYSRVVIPANHTPTKVQIIARPNPKETLVVDHIEICAWKKI